MFTPIEENLISSTDDWVRVWEEIVSESRFYGIRAYQIDLMIWYSQKKKVALVQAMPVLTGYEPQQQLEFFPLWNKPIVETSIECDFFMKAIRWGQSLIPEIVKIWDAITTEEAAKGE